jgi:hypothetical protein
VPLINPPPSIPVDDTDGLSLPWRNFFSQAYRLLIAMLASGPTADRPTTFLWVGRQFFDSTLGYAIWWDGAQWVDATGAPA